MQASSPGSKSQYDTAFFGHPRGLATLFFTEMWERFSYYGMRALLILFMTASTSTGGLGFSIPKASAIYGIYVGLVYGLSLPGGWIADRFLGLRRSVFCGGILIAAGNLCLAVPRLGFFYLGLGLIVSGTGLLKPNVSTIVGRLYATGDPRRDSGFSIFYMGINLGAFIAPLIVGYVGQRVDWHMGFGLAAIGMVAGLTQYTLGGKYLGEAGLRPVQPESLEERARQRRTLALSGAAVGVLVLAPVLLNALGVIQLTAEGLNNAFGLILLAVVVASFAGLLFSGNWSAVERKRLYVVAVLFFASMLFWSLFEQAGSTLTLFAERNTDKTFSLGNFSYLFPASWFQSVQPILIVVLAPVFAWIWIALGKRNPSSPLKFALGLFFAAAGFLVLIPPAMRGPAAQASYVWLLITYFLHTLGELSLSPVGLSAMTKLAPTSVGGRIMGLWFLSTACGNYLGARVSGLYESMPLPKLFGAVSAVAIIFGLILALFAKPIKELMGGAE